MSFLVAYLLYHRPVDESVMLVFFIVLGDFHIVSESVWNFMKNISYSGKRLSRNEDCDIMKYVKRFKKQLVQQVKEFYPIHRKSKCNLKFF